MMDDVPIYMAFGDSITSGNNVRRAERYPSILGKYMQQTTRAHPVRVYNLGQNGQSSSKMHKFLRTPTVLAAVSRANFVTVCIGGDDLIYGYIKWRVFGKQSYLHKSMKKLYANYDKICYLLRTAGPSQCVLSTFYNPFPHTPLAVDLVRYCNYNIIYPLAERYGFPMADIYDAFNNREHLLIDHYRSGRLEDYRPFTRNSPIHPNVFGYRVIAECFIEKI